MMLELSQTVAHVDELCYFLLCYVDKADSDFDSPISETVLTGTDTAGSTVGGLSQSRISSSVTVSRSRSLKL